MTVEGYPLSNVSIILFADTLLSNVCNICNLFLRRAIARLTHMAIRARDTAEAACFGAQGTASSCREM